MTLLRTNVFQVWSVLEALDRDYKRDEDWCTSDKSASANRAAFLVQLINKHNEQKEAFLRVRSPTFPDVSGSAEQQAE